MGERTLVIDHLKFSYEGLFNPAELYSLISSWFYEKGWDWYERMNKEISTPEGKQIVMILEPWKSVTDFYKIMAKIKIIFTNIKEVEVEHEGKTLRLSQGLIRITYDGYVMSDRTGLWTEKPFYWFLTIVAQKYFFRNHFKKMETWIKSDLDDVHSKVKSYLNTFNYSYQT
tara:strand:- start:127 stop:639 length:513 start_codon:yes stop_codon:yes gene_type:complete